MVESGEGALKLSVLQLRHPIQLPAKQSAVLAAPTKVNQCCMTYARVLCDLSLIDARESLNEIFVSLPETAS